MDRLKNLLNEILNGQWQLQLAGCVFLSVILIISTSLFYEIVDMMEISGSTGTPSRTSLVAELDNKNVVLNNILNTPIFGSYVKQNKENINTTLVLVGVMSDSQAKNRRAFISEPNKLAKAYVEGDEISKGLKVYRISRDKVELMRYGKPETLYISWKFENGGKNTFEGASSTSTPSDIENTAVDSDNSASVEQKKLLEDIRQRILEGRGSQFKGLRDSSR